MNDYDTGLEIAVIGMSGRFPEADTLEQFWTNLMNGKDSFSHLNEEELRENGVSEEELKDSNYIKVKPFLDNIFDFDAELFGYTAWEAEYMDPQIRLFHECVYHALEDAGYDSEQFKGRIGLYAGASTDLQWMKCLLMSQKNLNNNILETSVVSSKDFISQLISYKLNLTGPSISLYTACSTSLVSVHLACSGILLGDCNMAVAGGVTIMMPNKSGYQYSEGSIYSKYGQLRPYDEHASGTVFGEGAGAVVLKRLSDAIADKDHIYAVIRSTACNNDGNRKVGFTAPSVEGQKEVIQTAFEMGEVDPLSVQIIEGHGTGTNVGDPIEVEALKQAFDTDKKEFCALGSVKANIGHLNAGAGIASFIKAVLALKNEVIPPACQFDAPNQKINITETPFYINREPVKMLRKNGPLRAGVSSFGVGGTNIHIILQEAPNEESSKAKMNQEVIINMSAKTEQSLKEMSENMVQYLEQHKSVNLMDVAFTLNTGRKQYKYNKCCIARDATDAIRLLSGKEQVSATSFVRKPKQASIGFLFSGQGSICHWVARKLYKEEPYFQSEMDRLAKKMMPTLGVDVRKILCSKDKKNDGIMKETSILQPAIFAFEYTLARYFIHIGIKPDLLMGQGLGQYTAAAVAGVFNEEDAIRIIIERRKLVQSSYDKTVELFRGVIWNEAQIPIWSSMTGKLVQMQQLQSASYWVKQMEMPVRWDNMIDALHTKDWQYLDLGAEPMFSDLLLKNGTQKVNVWSPIEYKVGCETENSGLLKCLSSLLNGGAVIDWTAFYEGKDCYRVSLPLYSFQRKCYKPAFLKNNSVSMAVSELQAEAACSVSEEVENTYVFERPEEDKGTYVAPEIETDKIVCEVVSKVLSMDRIGIQDDFFWLGAHSLLITKIISRLNEIFRTEIPLDQVMEDATVEAIHRLLVASWGNEESLNQIALAYREYQQMINV